MYTEIPRVFWALGILFYLSLFFGVGVLMGLVYYVIFISFCFLVSVGYRVTYYTGLGDHLGIECNHFCYCQD